MRFLKSFAQFWYDFLIGDDWKIAAGVILALAVVTGALRLTSLGDVALTLLGGVALLVAFSVSLMIDVRDKKS
jgi:hypothetical protein